MSSSHISQPSVMAARSYSLLKLTQISFGNMPEFCCSPESHIYLRLSENVRPSQESVYEKGLKGKQSQVRLIERNVIGQEPSFAMNPKMK